MVPNMGRLDNEKSSLWAAVEKPQSGGQSVRYTAKVPDAKPAKYKVS